jgi:hypothetical protein
MKNPHTAHETPLQPVKIYVWCAVPRYRIAGPIFFENTIHSEHYTFKVHEFLWYLTDYKIAEAWF